MSRTVAQDFARWRGLTPEGRGNVVASLAYDKTHDAVCGKNDRWPQCPWCAAIAVLGRVERKLMVRVVRK